MALTSRVLGYSVAVYFEDASERRFVGELGQTPPLPPCACTFMITTIICAGRYLALMVSVVMMMAVCLSYHYVIVSTTTQLLAPVCTSPILCGGGPDSHWFWTGVTAVRFYTILAMVGSCVLGNVVLPFCALEGGAFLYGISEVEISDSIVCCWRWMFSLRHGINYSHECL